MTTVLGTAASAIRDAARAVVVVDLSSVSTAPDASPAAVATGEALGAPLSELPPQTRMTLRERAQGDAEG
jgi:hypothetical protein